MIRYIVVWLFFFTVEFIHSLDIKSCCDELVLKNLSDVEQFLDFNICQGSLTIISGEGLYYKTLHKGIDSRQVDEKDWPSLKIDIFELDSLGKEKFSFSIEPAKKINLEVTIEALRKGVRGMRVGEKRRIFAHPKFTHGEIGFFAPEHYVIFDVEVFEK